MHNEMYFFGKFILYSLLYLEVELLIVIQLYFITVNWLPTFKYNLLPLFQKLLIAAPKSQPWWNNFMFFPDYIVFALPNLTRWLYSWIFVLCDFFFLMRSDMIMLKKILSFNLNLNSSSFLNDTSKFYHSNDNRPNRSPGKFMQNFTRMSIQHHVSEYKNISKINLLPLRQLHLHFMEIKCTPKS